MSMLTVIIIFVCICVDNMVSANMSAVKMTKENKSVFSVKLALVFTLFNVLLFGLGYILSILFHKWSYFAHNWVAFALLLLLGIKFMLEYIEKSPSFGDADAGDNWKLAKVSALIGMNSLFVGYVVETMERAFFPEVVILLILTFVLSLLGAHLGGTDYKNLLSKKLELLAGVVLIVISIMQIFY